MRHAVLALFAFMATAGCSALGGESARQVGTQARANADADASKHVDLVWYLLGDPHPDTEKVLAAWNKMLERDLNTTVKLYFTSWNDWQTRYNLILTSGEPVDLIFTSSWANFYTLMKQGAFMDITDLIPAYAPQTWNTVPKKDWDDVSLNGRIYSVPATFTEYSPTGFIYREDWRKELRLPPITNLDTLEAYMRGIKQNKPGVIPINGPAYDGIKALFKYWSGVEPIGGQDSMIGASAYGQPQDIVVYPFTDEFAAFVKRMKKWAESGFWSADALVSKEDPGQRMLEGTGGLMWKNPSQAGGYDNELRARDIRQEIGYFPFTRFHGYAVPNLASNNGMAVPKSSVHAERTLLVLDKLRNDPAYFDLMTYGMEGVHYALAPDGKYIILPTPAGDSGKPQIYGISSWGWWYAPNMRGVQGAWPELDRLNAEFQAESKPNVYEAIPLDYAPVRSQLAAVQTVMNQYGKPLMLGLVKDVDAALGEYREQLKLAGAEKLADYVRAEAKAYYAAKGIK